jgi:hypothetical protein
MRFWAAKTLYSVQFPKINADKRNPSLELVFTNKNYFVKSNRFIIRFWRLYTACRFPHFFSVFISYKSQVFRQSCIFLNSQTNWKQHKNLPKRNKIYITNPYCGDKSNIKTQLWIAISWIQYKICNLGLWLPTRQSFLSLPSQ